MKKTMILCGVIAATMFLVSSACAVPNVVSNKEENLVDMIKQKIINLKDDLAKYDDPDDPQPQFIIWIGGCILMIIAMVISILAGFPIL